MVKFGLKIFGDFMKLLVYPLLSTRSRRWMLRKDRKTDYIPRHMLMNRLKTQLGMTDTEIINQCLIEREYLLSIR